MKDKELDLWRKDVEKILTKRYKQSIWSRIWEGLGYIAIFILMLVGLIGMIVLFVTLFENPISLAIICVTLLLITIWSLK